MQNRCPYCKIEQSIPDNNDGDWMICISCKMPFRAYKSDSPAFLALEDFHKVPILQAENERLKDLLRDYEAIEKTRKKNKLPHVEPDMI